MIWLEAWKGCAKSRLRVFLSSLTRFGAAHSFWQDVAGLFVAQIREKKGNFSQGAAQKRRTGKEEAISLLYKEMSYCEAK